MYMKRANFKVLRYHDDKSYSNNIAKMNPINNIIQDVHGISVVYREQISTDIKIK